MTEAENIPNTPAECRAEQERVLTLLASYDEADARFNEEFDPNPTVVLALREAESVLAILAPTIARQNAALLAAHAEALADLELLRTNRDQLAADNETLSTWNAALEAEMRGYRASRSAAHAEALERLEQERQAHERTIAARDRAREAADRLAYALYGVEEIGEHTNLNCPWDNAAERLEALLPTLRKVDAERDMYRVTLQNLQHAAANMLTGIEVNNRLHPDAPARRKDIAGPVVTSLRAAVLSARVALSPNPPTGYAPPPAQAPASAEGGAL